MAVKPLVGAKVATVNDFRDREHMDLLKTVWFDEFDEMFELDVEAGHSMLLSSRTIHFDVEVGLDNGDIEIGLHPSITQQHLYWISKKVRQYFLEGKDKEVIELILGTNSAISLIEMGVLPSIVGIYYEQKVGEKWHDVHFSKYKKKKEEEAVDEQLQGK